MNTKILEEISLKLQNGKTKDIKVLVPKALEEGVPAKDILNNGLLAGMSIVGVKFKNNEIFVPEVLIAARAMKAGAEILKPYLVSAAKENDANIIACSALLTTTMAEMKNVVDLCVAEGIRENVKIMIGGAPITDEYCKEIGADAYTSDAATAAETAVSLIA